MNLTSLKSFENRINQFYLYNISLEQLMLVKRAKNSDKKKKTEFQDDQYKLKEVIHDSASVYLENIENFKFSLERLQNFMKNIGEIGQKEIRRDVKDHIYDVNKGKQLANNILDVNKIKEFASQRVQKMIKMKKIKKNWCQQDLKLLIWIVSKYADLKQYKNIDSQLTNTDWDQIVSMIPGCSKEQCFYKWLNLRNIRLSTNGWSDYEAQLLRAIVIREDEYIKGEEINWKQVSKKLYVENTLGNKIFRSSKLCKQHWGNFLKPELKKGPWELQEDILLLDLVKEKQGKRKWTELSLRFKGRTQNSIKNRFNLLIEKQKKYSKSKQLLSLISDCLEAKIKSLQSQKNKVVVSQEKNSFLYHVEEEPKSKADNTLETMSEISSVKMLELKVLPDNTKVQVVTLHPIQFLRTFSGMLLPGVLMNGRFVPTQ